MVLRSGGEYTPAHVARLAGQISEHLPGAEIVCLSDVPVPCTRISLDHDWPGWWAKLECYRPDIEGDLLYFDLDTSIVGPLAAIATTTELTVMSDAYRPERVQSSIMFLPQEKRAQIWQAFTADPVFHMKHGNTRDNWGDQGFLNTFWGRTARRWDRALPGQVVSYKVHCRKGVPEGARVVVFHGKPRPWAIGW